MTEIEDHPRGWARTSVGEVAIYQNGRAFKPSEWGATGLPIIRIQNLNDPSANYNYSDKQHEKKFLIKNGDLLFAWSASLGAYLWQGQDAWLNQHIFRVDHTKTIDRQFLYHALTNITNDLYAKAHGSGMVHVTKGKFEETPIWLPPRNEQRRIVTKIEELFSELDKGIESLKTARAKLNAYRQAVLKHAFEGKLTAQWREENRDKLETPEQLLARIKRERYARYEQQLQEWQAAVKKWEGNGKSGKKPAKPKPVNDPSPISREDRGRLPDFPERWAWVRLGQLFSISPQNGVYKPASEYGSGTQIIRIDDFYDGRLNRRTGFRKLHLSNEEIKKYKVQNSDLIINRVNSIEYLGKCALVEGLTESTVFESNIMRCCVIEDVISTAYVSAYLASHEGRNRLCENAKHAVNQASINQTDVGNTLLPITSMEEQLLIVKKIEHKLSQTDALISEIESHIKKAEVLRQSILKKAFSGQLVPQDPDDEPASSLLERIKAEKPARSQNNTRAKRRSITATA